MKEGLTFNELRAANVARLPQFKNKHGQAAHAKEDGSDWTPAQWLQALTGELGEFATVRLAYEEGRMSYEEYRIQAQKELADVGTYLDLLARRALDKTSSPRTGDPARCLMLAISAIGEYANDRKKFERGDHNQAQFAAIAPRRLTSAVMLLNTLHGFCGDPPRQVVTEPHPIGVQLGYAITTKFNEVSRRVGADVFLPLCKVCGEPGCDVYLAHNGVFNQDTGEVRGATALSQAVRDVLTERKRQIEVEGWTPEHDDEHGDSAMAVAAACYALASEPVFQRGHVDFPGLWRWTGWAMQWWKPKDKRRNLVRATALLLAEIEREDRKAGRAHGALGRHGGRQK